MTSRLSERCQDALSQFPSADALAVFLHQQGIVGVVRDSRRCPLARFLNQQLGRDQGRRVLPLVLDLGPSRARDVAVEFLSRFDAGAYPDLIDHTGRKAR